MKKLFNKIYNKIISFKDAFLKKFKENKFGTILQIFIFLSYLAFSLLLPTTSYTKFHNVPFAVAGVLAVLIVLWILIYGKFYLDYPTVMMFAFLFFNLFSWAINGFKNFNQTVILLPILFLIFYQYLKNTKRIKEAVYILFLGFLFFAFVYSIYYAEELISLDFKRLGDAFGNVNGIGGFFCIGFAFSLYYGFFEKKYQSFIYLLLFAFLGITTGSRTVILLVLVSFIAAIIIKFGRKKWYFAVSIFAIFLIIGIIVLRMPMFSYISTRIEDMFYLFVGGKTKLADSSSVIRSNLIKEGAYGSLTKLLFGYGHLGFQKNITSYNTYAHNNYIEVVSDYGILGLFAFESIIFIPIFRYFFKSKNVSNDENIEKLKRWMLIFAIFLVFYQLTGVQSISKESYILMMLISIVSTEGYRKEGKKTLCLLTPLWAQNIFVKMKVKKFPNEFVELNNSDERVLTFSEAFSVVKAWPKSLKQEYLSMRKHNANQNIEMSLVFGEKKKSERKTAIEINAVTNEKEVGKVAKEIIPASRKEKANNSFFIVFLTLQSIVAFSFSFYSNKLMLLQSAVEIANKEQVNNEDPFVQFKDIKQPESMLLTLQRQSEEHIKFENIYPYLEIVDRTFMQGSETIDFKGISVADSTLNLNRLSGLDVPVYSKSSDLINEADYEIMITSRSANSIMVKEGYTSYDELIGNEYIDNDGHTYAINNIIFNTDESIIETENNFASPKLDKNELVTHLTNMYDDFIVYVSSPVTIDFTYQIAFTPDNFKIIDYIESVYGDYITQADDQIIDFLTFSNEDNKYVVNATYNVINEIYATKRTNADNTYSILLTIVAVASFVLDVIVILDAMKGGRENTYLAIPLSIITILSFIILTMIRLLVSVVQIAVLANNFTFIFVSAIVSLIWITFMIKIVINKTHKKTTYREANVK